MLGRRSFLSFLPVALLAPVALASAAPSADAPVVEAYDFVGLLEPNTVEATLFDYATLDGVRIDHVVRAHDADGWIEFYPIVDRHEGYGRVRLHKCHRRGIVRFFFRDEEPASYTVSPMKIPVESTYGIEIANSSEHTQSLDSLLEDVMRGSWQIAP